MVVAVDGARSSSLPAGRPVLYPAVCMVVAVAGAIPLH